MKFTRRGLLKFLVPAAVAAPTLLEELLNTKTYFLPPRSAYAPPIPIVYGTDRSVLPDFTAIYLWKPLYGREQYPIALTRGFYPDFQKKMALVSSIDDFKKGDLDEDNMYLPR